MSIDTSYRQRRLEQRLQDPDYEAAYDQASAEIAQIDGVMRILDELRIEAGISKAELARQIHKNPASVRRLFSSEANPELKTVVALASALGAEVVVKKRSKTRRRSRATAA